MPLAAPPNRGFSEFQRTGPYDSGVLFSDFNDSLAAPISTSVLDVSRFAYLAGYDQVLSGDGRAVFKWWADADGTIPVGQRSLSLTSSGTPVAQYRLPNLGPFVTITWTSISGAGTTHLSEIFSTNRSHPCELIPMNPVPLDQDATAIGASATATVYPSDYYAGPMMVWSTISGGGTVFFQYLTSSGTWSTISQWPVAALTNDTRTVIAPPGAWRFQVLNGAASGQVYNLKVTPSLTGGS